ncbi:MAG: ferrous iron transport protein B, partial [Bacteroidia bacterium]
MDNQTHSSLRRVAIVGRPNCGKSTLFNLFTGLNQKTANFPGVTVDKKVGTTTIRHKQTEMEVQFMDLPGMYSLYPRSMDEEVAVRVLTDNENPDCPDLTLIVADATNLRHCLFLTGQIIDLGAPCVLVLNMMDEADKAGAKINIPLLASRLGIPVVGISAKEEKGIDNLKEAIGAPLQLPSEIFVDTSKICPEAVEIVKKVNPRLRGWKALYQATRLYATNPEMQEQLSKIGFSPAAAQTEENLLRQGTVGKIMYECTGKATKRPELTTKLDRILTHRVWGYVVFVAILFLIFQSIFILAEYPMNWIESGFMFLGDWSRDLLPEGILTDLFIDGILAGLSGVVVFVPQIALLFFFIAVLEDSGYMARVSFIMDRVMRRFGLHGRSLIPLISGLACAVPAIMSTRTIG